jgi:queuine tRNA-ribosyltransferase
MGMASIFAPILNSTAGLTLTPEQWKRTGLEYFGWDVLQLLQRPDYAKMIYIPGQFILDARGLSVSGSGNIAYRGTDGAKRYISEEALFEFLITLKPDYVAFDRELPDSLTPLPEHFLVTDWVSNHAYHGHFLAQTKLYSILDVSYVQDFRMLDHNCLCESCEQGFTRAYLHHLLQHTPMLAQRYLMMHNMFVASREPEIILHLIDSV